MHTLGALFRGVIGAMSSPRHFTFCFLTVLIVVIRLVWNQIS